MVPKLMGEDVVLTHTSRVRAWLPTGKLVSTPSAYSFGLAINNPILKLQFFNQTRLYNESRSNAHLLCISGQFKFLIKRLLG
jgi:hypothetical protein